jgi:hypothetical protein
MLASDKMQKSSTSHWMLSLPFPSLKHRAIDQTTKNIHRSLLKTACLHLGTLQEHLALVTAPILSTWMILPHHQIWPNDRRHQAQK